MARADFLTGLLSGLGGSFTEQLKAKQESRQKLRELEQQEKIKAKYRQPDAASQRLQLLLQAIGVMGQPTPIVPAQPVTPTVTQPTSPLATSSRTPVTQPGVLRGLEGLIRRVIPTPSGVEVNATRQETLNRLIERARTAPDQTQFMRRGSVNRLIETLGIAPQALQQLTEGEQAFPSRQQEFEQATTKRKQAQLMLQLLGYRSPQDQDDPIVQTATDADTGEKVAITQSGQVIPLQ